MKFNDFAVKFLLLSCAMLPAFLSAATTMDRGGWRIGFDETTSQLTLVHEDCNIRLSGELGFVSNGAKWRVVESRDAERDRLSLVNPGNTVLGYVSFRANGDRLEFEVLHRAGANFFPGRLVFDGSAVFRDDSFACRTFPQRGEKVLNFGDGAADSPLNDSLFAREEDLALRFASQATRLAAAERSGEYRLHLEADIDDPASSVVVVDAARGYYRNRWAPGYHPIDRKRCPKAPTGWMSWNIYFDKAGSAENLAEARIGAKYLLPFGLEIWSVESWQDNSLWLPVSSFHHHANRCYSKQFPEGMKWLAGEFRKLGFKPGLWMSLYGEGDDEFYQAHKELYLHDASGKPINNWAGKYMLDTTNPEALSLMTRLARQAKEEWGYDFFKFDGMANTPRKFERPEIRARAKNPADAKWFENSVKALREGIGDSIFLACMGDFTGTEVKYVDASRLGSDVVGCYRGLGDNYNSLGNSSMAQMPVKWANVLHQAECTFTQIFVNNIMFYTDPDTLMVGYALEQHEAEVMATIVGLPGQLMFNGDRLGSLRADRMKMIQQVLPVADIHPQNLFPYAASAMMPVWNLAVTRSFDTWRVTALFNWTDAPKDLEVGLAELGLDPAKKYAAYEFWGGEYLGEISGSLKSTAQPMRSVKLFSLREVKEHPQFVGDDRHLTMGAVELADLRWNAAAKTYTLAVKAIGGFPFTYAVRVPEDFQFKSAAAPAGVKLSVKKSSGLVRVTVESSATATIPVTLTF